MTELERIYFQNIPALSSYIEEMEEMMNQFNSNYEPIVSRSYISKPKETAKKSITDKPMYQIIAEADANNQLVDPSGNPVSSNNQSHSYVAKPHVDMQGLSNNLKKQSPVVDESNKKEEQMQASSMDDTNKQMIVFPMFAYMPPINEQAQREDIINDMMKKAISDSLYQKYLTAYLSFIVHYNEANYNKNHKYTQAEAKEQAQKAIDFFKGAAHNALYAEISEIINKMENGNKFDFVKFVKDFKLPNTINFSDEHGDDKNFFEKEFGKRIKNSISTDSKSWYLFIANVLFDSDVHKSSEEYNKTRNDFHETFFKDQEDKGFESTKNAKEKFDDDQKETDDLLSGDWTNINAVWKELSTQFMINNKTFDEAIFDVFNKNAQLIVDTVNEEMKLLKNSLNPFSKEWNIRGQAEQDIIDFLILNVITDVIYNSRVERQDEEDVARSQIMNAKSLQALNKIKMTEQTRKALENLIASKREELNKGQN